ncbi:MAG TPA: alpha/beta hydrolase [Spirochaetia bacterium]|nr:alpha/beta hydrolase [Spirochaetia bacterium]
MPLHPEVKGFLRSLGTQAEPDVICVADVRAMLEARAAFKVDLPEETLVVRDITIPGPAGEIPVRLYAPVHRDPLPVLCFFHGGGFVTGSLNTHDAACRWLAAGTPCLVVSVDYRLAPEHKFPAAPDDAYAAVQWVAANAAAIGGDAGRVAVGGDSAGGNLAAVVSLMARDRGGPSLRFQLLVYPAVNCIGSTRSFEEYGEGEYFLTTRMMKWFNAQYFARESDISHPYASPLLAPDLSNLPPALVLTPEYDPLRDEGEVYAIRLQRAGNQAVCMRVMGHVHPFFTPAFTAGKLALLTSAGALRMAFTR